MRITVNGGHTPTSPGAGKYLDEVRCDRAVKDALIAELRARGHAVTDCTADDRMPYPEELDAQVARANASGAALAISIHFNAGGGTGCEALYHPASAGGEGERVAARISSALASLMRIPNRGAKQRGDLGWLNGTDMTAVLVEVCFVDSRADEAAYNRVGPAAVARAIADAVVGGASGGEWVTDAKGWWYRRADGSWPAGEWLLLDAWYRFDDDGYAATGWREVGGKWYLLGDDCRMLTGWQLVGGKWYYLDDSGAMATGWRKVDGKWYWLDGSGAMQTGWLKLGGTWYWLDDSGAMAESTCRSIGGKWYAFGASGAMISGEVPTAEGGDMVLG